MIALNKIDVINQPNQEIEVKQDSIINVNPAPPYEGEYNVTPKFEAQTLPTAEKLLAKDVIIEEIPYAEVTNNSGGTTVTIG